MPNAGISIAITDKDKLLEGVPTPLRLEVLDYAEILEEAGSDWINFALQGDFSKAQEALTKNLTTSALLTKSTRTSDVWNNLVSQQVVDKEKEKAVVETAFRVLLTIMVAKSGLPISIG